MVCPCLSDNIRITGVHYTSFNNGRGRLYYIDMEIDSYRYLLWADTFKLVKCGIAHSYESNLHPLEIPYINKICYFFNKEIVIKPPTHRTIYFHNNTWTTERPR